MCIALSVSELVSAYPTSGGLYFTCKYLAPEKWVPEISWICGWLNLLGQIAGVASTEYGAAQLLLAAVSMGSNNYKPTQGHTVGVMAAITMVHGAINSLNTSALEKITKSYVLFHIGILVSCCITLLVMCKDKNSTHYVWTDVTPDSGWTPTGWSFLFGFLSVSWTMTDYDATAHIAEEIKNPELKAPWSITAALGFTYIGGWLFTIVLAYCMGDPAVILTSEFGQPVAQIFYNNIGKAGGIFFTVAAFVIMNFTAITAIQAGSRTVWAYSRDEMLPLSRVWHKINRVTTTPLYAVWVFTISCILIDLIGLGSYITIAAIFNICAIALDWSYCIPIILKILYGKFKPGPWHLGRASFWVNLWAVTWTLFVSIIFILPTARPVTPANVSGLPLLPLCFGYANSVQMNYAVVILVGIGLFALLYWVIAGRFYYFGPRVKAQLIVASAERSSGDSSGEAIAEKNAMY